MLDWVECHEQLQQAAYSLENAVDCCDDEPEQRVIKKTLTLINDLIDMIEPKAEAEQKEIEKDEAEEGDSEPHTADSDIPF